MRSNLYVLSRVALDTEDVGLNAGLDRSEIIVKLEDSGSDGGCRK